MKEMILEQEVEIEIHKHPGDLFNPVSRALTKYLYEMSKVTPSKLQTLVNMPLKKRESVLR
jgi:hypothetical protein